MNQQIPDVSDQTLSHIAKKYKLNPARLTMLAGNVNKVYEHVNPEHPTILRLTPVQRRTLEEILAEADFVHYLAQKGGPVADVIPASDGNLAVGTEQGWYAVLFAKAQGRLPRQEDWNEQFYYMWGKLTGWLHAQSCAYTPAVPARRRQWWEDDLLKIEESIPRSETQVLQRARELMDRLHSFTKDSNSYGLIHNDLHMRNFFIDDNRIMVFDFDDCCYRWFINDIAVILYHALARFGKPPGRWDGEKAFATHFLTHFKRGYETEHQLDAFWWLQLPVFMKLRRVAIYVFYHQALDFAQLSEERVDVIHRTRWDIEQDFPVTQLDLADWLSS